MRTTNIAAAIVAPCLTVVMGCAVSPAGSSEMSAIEAQEVTACPSSTSNDSVFRVTASLALTLMVDEADAWGVQGWTLPIMSVLAPHRYRVQSSGTGIEFDPNDPLYGAVTDTMKAHLAFPQLDSTVAKFLSDGLKYAYSTTNGAVFPRMRMALALENYKYPVGMQNTAIFDSTTPNPTTSHYASVSGNTWCGGSVVTLSDTVKQSWQYSPLDAQPITAPVWGGGAAWYASPPAAFKGTKATPWTPFNGSVSTGNPYLIVTVNGQVTNWATYNWGTVDCTKLANQTCSGTVQIDPVPYAEPGTYYDSTGAMVGTQSNPFTIIGTLYATSDHQSQWATRTVNSVQEWGTFSTAVSILGIIEYKYVKQH
jgi:hypothetical protein